MKECFKVTSLFIALLAFSPVWAQTGPDAPGQNNLNIFAGSGQNQILVSGFENLSLQTL